jgi:ribosomal protein L37AE/L43A
MADRIRHGAWPFVGQERRPGRIPRALVSYPPGTFGLGAVRGGGPKEEAGRPKGPTAGPARIALAVGLPVCVRARATATRQLHPSPELSTGFSPGYAQARLLVRLARDREERPRAASRDAAVTAVPQLAPGRLEADAPPETPPAEGIAQADAGVKGAPGHHQERFRCPNPKCGRSFTRNVRVGIWAACPTCGTRAYGLAVLQQFAGEAAGRAIAPRRKRERKAAPGAPDHQPAVIGAFSADFPTRPRARSHLGPLKPSRAHRCISN